MTALSTADVLNRVLVVHNRSLVQYLIDAMPWFKFGEEKTMLTLRQIVRDQQQVVDRLAAILLEMNVPVELGEYPMPFTGYHDVAFDWLLHLLIDRQEKTIAYLQKCAELLSLAPMAKAVVEETVGMAKGHLEMLEELRPLVNGFAKPVMPRQAVEQ